MGAFSEISAFDVEKNLVGICGETEHLFPIRLQNLGKGLASRILTNDLGRSQQKLNFFQTSNRSRQVCVLKI